jgi:Carboxypeptidase regulatory-like domain
MYSPKMLNRVKGPLPMMMCRTSLASLFVLLWSCTVLAQFNAATLSGRITDPQGKVVPKVQVQLVDIDTNVGATTETNGDGIYVLSAIQPGRYRLTVRKDGFHEILKPEFTLHTQDNLEQNFSLEIGSVSETVTVNANSEHMATDSAAVGLLVNRDFVENMPLNGRSFEDLIALAPGALTNSNSSPSGDFTNAFSINGQRPDANYFTVDGVAANVSASNSHNGPLQAISGVLPAQTALGTTQALISVDALQEFKIQTSGYSAEYGRQPGGQIELTTRAGANDIHGSVFDYFRNTVFDANSWFADQQGASKSPEHQNDFGGTLGGPLRIPGVYNGKDKTFYFVSYEGLRLDLPVFVSGVSVPSLELRAFAAPGVQPFLNATPIPNGKENGDQCAISLGYTFSCTAQWSGGYSNPSSLDAVSVRVDQLIRSNIQAFARYSNTPSKASSYQSSEFDTTRANYQTVTLGSTVRIGSSLLNETRFNYSVTNATRSFIPTNFGGAVPYPKSLLMPLELATMNNALVLADAFAQIPGANTIYVPATGLSKAVQHQYNLVNSVSWLRGRHNLKFGADYRRLPASYSPSQYESVIYLTSLAGVQQGFADLALIEAYKGAHPIFNNLSLYAEDHLKLTPRLTIDYGVRWEFNPPPGASDGVYPTAFTTSNPATAQIAPAGTPQYHTTYHDFAPRLGFAYQVNSATSHPFAVRGGFGIFYDTGQALGAAGYQGDPFFRYNVDSNFALPATQASLAPPSFSVPRTPPYSFFGVNDPNLKLPYTEQWNLSVDQGLGVRNTLTVSYVGNVERKLLFEETYNNPQPALAQVTWINNGSSSSYNALQIQDSGFLGRGLQLIAAYTWAHARDNSSADTPGYAPIWGNSDNDVRQAFNIAINYKIPGAESNTLVRVLTRGWSLDNRFTALSGYPVYVYQNIYYSPNVAPELIIPDQVPGVPVYLHNVPNVLGGWGLNPAAFSPVATDPSTGMPLAQGTLGRNSIHGPAFWSLNAGVQRNFPLYEKLNLIFRVEAFNLFNHPNAGSIDGCLCDSTFGRSVNVPTIGTPNSLYSTGSPRSLQFVLKLQF